MSEDNGVRQVKFNSQTIVDILSNFNVKVTPQDLKGQNLEKLIEIYKSFLKNCLSLDEPTFETFTFEVTSNFPDDVLTVQRNAFKKIQLYTLIFGLFQLCGLKGHFSEVFFPAVHGKNFFTKQLSTLVNFARFEYIQLEDFLTIQTEYQAQSKEVAEFQSQNSWYKGQIQTLKQDKMERKIPIENSKKRIAGYQERLTQIRTHNQRCDDEIAKQDKEIQNMTTEKENLSSAINTNEKRSQFLDKLVIKSPEKLKKDIDRNKIKIEEAKKMQQSKKEENEKLESYYVEREKLVDSFKFLTENLENFYQNDVKSANKMLEEIETNKAEKIELQFQIEQLESKIRTNQNDILKKRDEYEAFQREVEKEMTALKDKDEQMQAQIDKSLAREKVVHKAILEAAAEQKTSRENFTGVMNKFEKTIEYIMIQRENVEMKRRVMSEAFNLARGNFIKRNGKLLQVALAEEENAIELLKKLNI